MTDELRSYVEKYAKALKAAGSACPEIKAAADAWLAAKGTDKEAEATKALVKECEEDITTIDSLIAFLQTPAGKSVFGDAAEAALERAKANKAAGEKYCFCDACQAAAAILERKAELV